MTDLQAFKERDGTAELQQDYLEVVIRKPA